MDFRTVNTTCSYCGCGCGLLLEVLDDKVISTLPVKTHPVSQGSLCIKGWNIHEFIGSDQRLHQPLLRKNGKLVPVGWDEAMDTAARGLKRVVEKYGPDAVAVLASAKVTNEENYLIQKFTRAAIGTNNVDHCARLCHSSTVVGLAAAFGSGAMTNSLPELADAKCIFIIGSNTTENHPITAKWIFRGQKNGAKLIVVDPRFTQIAFLANLAVQHRLGTDVALINGLMHIILQEGWHDQEYIKARTEGFAALSAKLEDYPPDKVAQITGIEPATLRQVAEMYAKNKPAAIVFCMGITQHTTGVDNVKSLANLAMLTGNVGVASSGVNPLRGQNNVQGACDMGGLPNVFTGYQPVADETANAKFSKAWGRDLPKKPGLTIPDMFDAIEADKVKAFYVVGENPLVTEPDLRHVESALKKLECFIVQDIFLTETAKNAGVVLAGASFAEKDGTFTNTERRVELVRQAIPPVGESRPDWQIVQDLSTRMGYPMNYASPEAIFQEIKELTPSYAGMSYARLADKGLQWPCPTPEHPGTVFLHQDRFSRGQGAFTAIDYKPPAEVADADYPMLLSTGRAFAHYHSGTMTRVSPSLDHELPEGYVEISPADARALKIRDGEQVKVSSRRGEIRIKAKISRKVDRGVVFIPFHFAEAAANVLTNPAFDPVAKIPEFKVCAVKVEKLAA